MPSPSAAAVAVHDAQSAAGPAIRSSRDRRGAGSAKPVTRPPGSLKTSSAPIISLISWRLAPPGRTRASLAVDDAVSELFGLPRQTVAPWRTWLSQSRSCTMPLSGRRLRIRNTPVFASSVIGSRRFESAVAPLLGSSSGPRIRASKACSRGRSLRLYCQPYCQPKVLQAGHFCPIRRKSGPSKTQ